MSEYIGEIPDEVVEFLGKENFNFPKLIRCKDCKYGELTNTVNASRGYALNVWCEVLEHYLTVNDFCSYGERKGADDEGVR